MHEVEKMFSVREMPWHKPETGDRTTVTDDYPQTFEEARKLSGLDWDPIEVPAVERLRTDEEMEREFFRIAAAAPGLTTEEVTSRLMLAFRASLQEDKDFRRIARSDNRSQTLSYQQDSYNIIPNSVFGEIIDSITGAEPGVVKLETGGCLAQGRKVWMLARLDEPVRLPGDGSLTFPFLGITSSHDGKAACAARLTTVRIVCHAEGTLIDDAGWRGEVQNHASATVPRLCAGKEVVVWGLPFCEKVTPEHRYWARGSKTNRGSRTGTTEAAWVEAKDLQAGYHEIGFPIDMTQEPASAIDLHTYTWRTWTVEEGRDARLDDPDWWWLIGYWWGNGTLHYGRSNRVSGIELSVNEDDTATAERIERLLRTRGWDGKPAVHPGCLTYVLSDATLGHFLKSWYAGKSRKTPPAWVERLPLDAQRQLVRGYWDADGDHKTADGAIISSVGLDGLLALRRILLRLGIPSSIRKGGVVTGTMEIQGRTVQVQQSYTIRFWRGIEQLGLTHRFKGRYSLPSIEDGHLWSRVKKLTDTPEEKFWPITTATHDYTTAFGRSHNCMNTFAAAEAEGERTGAVYSFSHRGKWRDRLGEAREALMFARRETAEYVAAMTELLGIKVTPRQEQLFLEAFIPSPPDGVISDRVARNIAEARATVLGFLNSATVEGAGVRGTAYGLVQGAGEYLDHARRANTWETKMNRSLLRAEPLKAKAAKLAREAALA